MNLPDIKEARKRTTKETDYIYLNQEYDKNQFANQKYFLISEKIKITAY